VLLLGSSRVSVNVDADAMAAAHPDGPLVFNFGINGSRPVNELVTLHRLFAAGVRPDWVVVDTHFTMYRPPPVTGPPDYRRFGWADVDVLKRHSDTPDAAERYRLSSHLAPWYYHRLNLQAQWAADLVPEGSRSLANDWNGITRWGFLELPLLDVPEADRPNNLVRVASTRRDLLARSERDSITDHSVAAFREMKGLCDRYGCRMAVLAMPDVYLFDYSEAARGRIDAELAEVSEGMAVPLVDFRRWGREEDFFDGVHLTRGAAARFTADFEPHLLRVVGDPTGRTGATWYPPPSLRWGVGFSPEETSDIPGWRRYRWCAPEGAVTITNSAPVGRRVTVTFRPQSHAVGPCRLTIDWPGGSEALTISATPTPASRTIDLPPGTHTVRFRCDGEPLVHPDRTVSFVLHEFTLQPVPPDGG
jgi:hypothetical protein